MSALAANEGRRNFGRNVPPMTWKAAATQVFYQGAIVLVKADGFAYVGVAYATASLGFVLGVATYALNTTGFASGALDVVVSPGTWGEFANSGGTIAEDDRGKSCFAATDNDVALTDTGGTLTRAGTIFDFTEDGFVVVQFEVIR